MYKSNYFLEIEYFYLIFVLKIDTDILIQQQNFKFNKPVIIKET